MTTNTNASACYEQALLAILSEIKKTGQDIDSICSAAKAGVLGNSLYSFIGTLHKVEVLSIIDKALVSTKEISINK